MPDEKNPIKKYGITAEAGPDDADVALVQVVISGVPLRQLVDLSSALGISLEDTLEEVIGGTWLALQREFARHPPIPKEKLH